LIRIFRASLRRFLPPAAAVLVCCTLVAPPAHAGSEEKALLEKIGVESVERTYRGQKIVIDFSRITPQVSKLTILHQLDGKERREYHSSRSVAVVDGDFFYQYHPSRNLIVKRKLPGEGGYAALRKKNLDLTLQSYSFRTEPGEEIAGRETRMFEFSPLQEGSRPRRRAWVDTETGLVLRMEIFSPENKLYMMSVFENIDYMPKVSPASFTMPAPKGVRVVESTEGQCLGITEAAETAQFPVGLPEYVPRGFVRKCVRAKKSRDYGEVQVLYSDGLSLLSLFQSSRFRDPAAKMNKGSRTLAVGDRDGELRQHGLLAALSWPSPWAQLTLIGEISSVEMVKVAESITPVREPSRP
jgi:outer membrane lipoprotein-sorting protein